MKGAIKMKKIIKHGQKKEMRTTCPYCGCEFSYEWEDVLTTEKSYPYEPTWTYYSYPSKTYKKYEIICPDCDKQFEILNWTINWENGNSSIHITEGVNADEWKRKTSITYKN